MKQIIFFLTIVLISTRAIAQIGIGTITPDTNAVLDLNSSAKVFILPRLTTTAINNILNPMPGMMVYNTTLGKFVGYAQSTSTSIAIQQTSGNYTTTTSNSTTISQISQTFIPVAPYPFLLNYVTAYIFTNSPTASLGATMTIQQGVPGGSGPVLGSTTLTIPPSSASSPNTATFSNLQLSPGQTYTITIAFSSSNTGLIIYTGSNNPYADGQYYENSNAYAGRDLKMLIGRTGFAWVTMNN